MIRRTGLESKLVYKRMEWQVQCGEANLLFSRSISAEISERVESSFEED